MSLVDIFLQQMINGLTLGSIYALVALGYTMVYGVLGLINFAHGEVVMVGALVALSVMNELAGGVAAAPMVLFLGVLAAVLVCMLLGGNTPTAPSALVLPSLMQDGPFGAMTV